MKSSLINPVPAARPRFFADMPIKGKLLVIIMAVTSAALAVSALGLLISDFVFFRQYLERDLTGLARITADNSTAALSFEDPPSATETLNALRARPHVMVACIYRPDGSMFARYERPGEEALCPKPAAGDLVQFTRRDITVSRAIMLTGRRIGTLMLLYDLEELYDRMRLYGNTVLVILLLSSLIAFVLSSRLRRVIADPISRLALITTAVSETRDYGLRAEKRSRDELGVLVDGFNGMLAGIQSRDQELRQALLAREEALKDAADARDFLKTTLASIGDAVVSTDAEGKVVFANPVACSLMRRPENQITGRSMDQVLRLIHEDTRAPLESPFHRTLREGVIAGLASHTILIARDGTEVPIDDSAAPIRNQRGELIGVVLIFRDITERRRAEQELRSAREQLQLVTDTMAPAVAHCGRDLRYIWVSRSYAEWMRSPVASFAGRPIEEVLGREALALIRPHIERVLSGERVEYENKLHFSNIGTRWIRASYVPTHDQAGAVDGWVAHVSDITALKNAEAEVRRINADLEKSNEQLARSNQDLERFAFVASHDLQEPLRMVTTYVQLLVRTYPAQFEGEGNMFVRHIVDGATRMRGLLSDLLSYSEIGGEPEEPPQSIDLNAVLETVRQNLRMALEETGGVISAGVLPNVSGHTIHFVQLLQNLVGNAIKYRSAEPPRIHISCETVDNWFRFAVADNGMGIDAAYHAKIFGVFKRLHGKKIPGTGIGLAICQRVVERYHGRIWVESEPGRGATFYFVLPQNTIESEEENNG